MPPDQMNPSANQPASPTPSNLSEEQIRTMRGDLGPAPATPPMPAPATPPTGTMTEPHLSVPEKPLFDADEPSFSPNTENQMSATPVDTLITQTGHKKMLWWIIGAVGIVVLGLVGYFFIYPMLGSVGSEPITSPEPVETTSPNPATVQPQHVSAFINEPGKHTVMVLPATLSNTAITQALTDESQVAVTGITELTFAQQGGNLVPFDVFLASLVPSFTDAAKTAQLFTGDFTGFIYKDEKGSWPGYIATLKPFFSPEELRSWFAGMEQLSLNEFFITTPGAMSAFKDGMINDKYADRYTTGATPGASFGYLILPQQGKVIISTSFVGFKEALRLMGL